MADKVRHMRTRHGRFAHLTDDHAIGSHLQRFGEWAEEEIFLLARIVDSGGVVLDVGAHVGTHTVPLSRLVGPNGRVLAFEAQARLIPLLTANVLRNGVTGNVAVFHAVVSDTAEPRLRPFAGRAAAGNSGAFAVGDPGDADGPPVAETAIDGLQLERCSLVKIDAPGYEARILQGAAETIGRCRPLLYYEPTGGDRSEIAQMLDALGYARLVHWTRVGNENNRNRAAGNLPRTVAPMVLAMCASRVERMRAAAERGGHIRLLPIESLTDAAARAAVPAPWRLPDGAYGGTRLLPYLDEIRSMGRAVEITDAAVLRTEGGWSGMRIPVDDLAGFSALAFDADLSDAADADLNMQVLFHVAVEDMPAGPPPWFTLVHGRGASAGRCRVQLTRDSLDPEALTALRGPGDIEIRCRAGRPLAVPMSRLTLFTNAPETVVAD